MKTEEKPPKMASLFDKEIENENLFEIDMEENNNEKLPIELFQELEVELLDSLLHQNNNNELSDNETDGPIDFIMQIVDSVREEFDGVVEKGDNICPSSHKNFSNSFKCKSREYQKNNQTRKINRFKSCKNMVRTKLVPKRIQIIRQWPPREPYTKFKIKTLLPEQKTIDIKKKWASN